MKLLPIAAVIAAFAFTPVAFAQTATPTPANKVDCEKAKMKWDEKGQGRQGRLRGRTGCREGRGEEVSSPAGFDCEGSALARGPHRFARALRRVLQRLRFKRSWRELTFSFLSTVPSVASAR